MAADGHDFEAFIKKINVGEKGIDVVLTIAAESDTAYTVTALMDLRKRGKMQVVATSMQPAFNLDDKGWELPPPG